MYPNTSPTRRWSPCQDDTGEMRLFCFPPAGGGVSFYRSWIGKLGPLATVHPLLLPGRESRLRETPSSNLRATVEEICEALLPLLDRPYALFGHSMGTLLAYEVARALGSVRPPTVLIVSGRRSPHAPTRRFYVDGRTDAEFLDQVVELGGIPTEILQQPAMIRMILPALRADFNLNENYRPLPGPRLNCPLRIYCGDNDIETTVMEALKWGEEADDGYVLRVFPGGHFYLKEDENLVLTAITNDLQTAIAK